MCGITSIDIDDHYNTIDYAVYLESSGYFTVYESGSWIGRFGTYEVGDVFAIERSGNIIKYKQNGTVYYTSLKTTYNSLMVDCSFSSNGSEIANATIIGFTAGVPGKIYDLKSAAGNTEINLGWSSAANNMYALTEYVIEYGTVASGDFASSVTFAAPATSRTIGGLANDTPYQFRIYAKNSQGNAPVSNVTTNTPDVFINVTWKDLENTTVSGSTMTKINTNAWDGGGASTHSFSDDGYLEFEASQSNRYRMIGLSSKNQDSNYTSIEYAISLNSNGQYYVYENGSHRGNFGYYSTGDIFKIERDSQFIKYKRNGSLFYTGSIPTSKGLMVDAAIYSIDGEVYNAKLFLTSGVPGAVYNLNPSIGNTEIILSWSPPATNGDALTGYLVQYGTVVSGAFASSQAVAASASTTTITGLVNDTEYQFRIYATNSNGDAPVSNAVTASPDDYYDILWDPASLVNVTATGNTITKNGVNGWDAGAASFTSFSGDGGVEFKADAINKYRMCGLSSVNRDENYNTIEYAISLNTNSNFYVYENGQGRGSFGVYSTDDIFTVERVGGAIRYKRNGSVFFVSSLSTDKGLMADAAIYTDEGTISEGKLVGISKGTPGEIYDLVSTIGDTEVILTWTAPANNGYALTEYVIQYGTVASSAFGSSVTIAAPSSTTKITGLVNGTEYQFRMYARNSQGDANVSNVAMVVPDSFIDVAWIDVVNATESGNTLTKSGSNGWDSGGVSFISFSGDGGVEFLATATNKNVVCGFSSVNTDTNYTTIEYAIRLNSNGRVYIYESGSSRGMYDYYSSGDAFRVERVGDIIRYKRNGDVFYTSRISTDKGLMVDGSLYNDESTISTAKHLGLTLGKPGSIKDLSMVSGGTEATLSWSKPANNGYAITGYVIEYGPISSGLFNSTLSASSSALNAIVTGLTNGEKYHFRIYATNSGGDADVSNVVTTPTSPYMDVVWIDPLNVNITGNTITKSDAEGWNAGAASFTSFSGNGGVVFEAFASDDRLMCGLASKNVDGNYNRINHAIYLNDNSYVYVYESGVYIGRFNTYQTGDTFIVERVGDSILYKQNDVIFLTSLTLADGLMADASINNDGGSVVNARLKGVTLGVPGKISTLGAHADGTEARLSWVAPANNGYDLIEYVIQYGTVASGAFGSSVTQAAPSSAATITGLTNGTAYQFRMYARNSQGDALVSNEALINTESYSDVVWIDQVGVTATGNTLTSNTSGWGNSGAASFTSFSGDGALEFQAAQNDTYRMAGLTSSNEDEHYNTIEYAVYLQGNGNFSVYEDGRNRGTFGTYQAGDWFSVERTGVSIEYKINNSLFYKSNISTDKGLMADCSFSSNTSEITTARLTGITTGPPGKITDLSGSIGDSEAILTWTPPANNGHTLTQYVIEYGTVASGTFATTVTVASPLATTTISGLTNGEKYQFRMYARNSEGDGPVSSPIYVVPNFTYDIVWVNEVGATATGNSITSDLSGWGDSGAVSFTSFSGEGAFEFKAAQTDRYFMCGLTSANIDEHYNTIEYAIYSRGDGIFSVYENGSSRGNFGEYSTGDTFIIERMGSIIRYKINGIVFYTSAITSDKGFMADCSFSSSNATINDAKFVGITKGPPGKLTNLNGSIGNTEVILAWSPPANNGYALTEYVIQYGTVASSAFGSSVTVAAPAATYTITGLTNLEKYQFRMYAVNSQGNGLISNSITVTPNITYDVVWIDQVGATATGNSITSDISGWGNSGAVSFTSFSGDGGFEFKTTQVNRSYMCGLSSKNIDEHYNTIDYSIYLQGNSRIRIYENGSSRGDFGQYSINDVFFIERDGSIIKYYKNGVVFYISSVPSYKGLMADCSFSSSSAVISNAKFAGITKGAPGNIVDLTAAVANEGAELSWTAPANNGYALTGYVIEYGTVASGAFGSSLIVAAPASTYTVTGLTNLEKYQFRIYAANSQGNGLLSNVATITPNVFVNINWIDRVNVTVSGNAVTNSASGWGNSGAVSFTRFSGNGGFEFKAGQTNRYLMAGLSSVNADAHYNTIDYAFYLQGNKLLRIYERGSYKGDFGAYEIGDSFSVERIGTTIVYKHNDEIVYASSRYYTGGLMADLAFSSTNASVTETKLVGIIPGPPGEIVDLIAKASDASVELEWSPPANNGHAILSYEIQYGPVYSGDFANTFIDDAVTGAIISGLSLGVEYQFRVFALNSAGAHYLQEGTIFKYFCCEAISNICTCMDR